MVTPLIRRALSLLPEFLMVTIFGPEAASSFNEPKLRDIGETVREGGVGKVAVTDLSSLITTVHVPVPVHPPPDQPPKMAPFGAVAVSTTVVFVSNSAEHSEPQLMPEEALETTPPVAPVFIMLRVRIFVTGSD